MERGAERGLSEASRPPHLLRKRTAKRSLRDLLVRIAGTPQDGARASSFLQGVFGSRTSNSLAELELLFHPGSGEFSRSVDCKVLVAANPLVVPQSLRDSADIVVPFTHRAKEVLAGELHLPVVPDAVRSAA